MKRLILPAAVIAAACLPAGAQAASGPHRATVLSVNARRHMLQVVGSDRLVHAYRYRGHVHMRIGSVISFRRQGQTLSAIRVTGRARSVSYLARVVKSSKHGLVLRLADGRRVQVQAGGTRAAIAHAATASAASAPAITVQIAGLQPGKTVLVTESVASDGSITITIALPAPAGSTPAGSGPGSDGSSDGGDATGAITAISDTSVTIATPSAGDMTFAVDPGDGLTDGFAVGDVVDVTYQTGDGGGNQAEDIEYVENDATGAVTGVSDTSLSITDSATGQTDTFTVDPSQGLLDLIAAGDQVDVTYHVSGQQLVADGVDDITVDNSGAGSGD